MPSDWRYKVIDLPPDSTVQTIKNNVKGMTSQNGDFPAETSLHGRLGGGLYAYAYPVPLERIEIYTEDVGIEAEKIGTLLKHKPKNSSILNPFTAVDVSTRVEGDIVCELDKQAGNELVDWIKENYREITEAT